MENKLNELRRQEWEQWRSFGPIGSRFAQRLGALRLNRSFGAKLEEEDERRSRRRSPAHVPTCGDGRSWRFLADAKSSHRAADEYGRAEIRSVGSAEMLDIASAIALRPARRDLRRKPPINRLPHGP